MFRCAFCSGACLEHRFKHMTTKQHQAYAEYLRDCWKRAVDLVAEYRAHCFMIVGDLFSTPKPSNSSIELVASSLKKLAEGGTWTVILPGARDTPLFHSSDIPAHRIFESLPKTVVVHGGVTRPRDLVVSRPAFAGRVAGRRVEFYAPPTPLVDPGEFEYRVGDSSDAADLTFLLVAADYTGEPDLSVFRDHLPRVNDQFLSSLDGQPLDYVVFGGSGAGSAPPGHDFSLVQAPPLIPTDFSQLGLESGVNLQDLDPPGDPDVRTVAARPYAAHVYDVTGKSPDTVNEDVVGAIASRSDPRGLFQLKLEGELSRDDYHKVRTYQYREKGARSNFYFELLDEIRFDSRAEDITGFNPLKEIERMVAEERESLLELSPGQPAGGGKPGEVDTLEMALDRVRRDWLELRDGTR
ncbi:MAG: hypothetical protein ACTSU5_12780 [Promethearchaeota archaeon]